MPSSSESVSTGDADLGGRLFAKRSDGRSDHFESIWSNDDFAVDSECFAGRKWDIVIIDGAELLQH